MKPQISAVIPTWLDEWDEEFRNATGEYPEFSPLRYKSQFPEGTVVRVVTWPDDLRQTAPTGNRGTR